MPGLTTDQLEQFGHDGYLIVENVLDSDDLAAIRAEYDEIMDRVAVDLVDRGVIRPLSGRSFSERYIEAFAQLDDMYTLYQHLEISLPMLDLLEPTATMNTGPAVFGLLTNSRLLDIAESVIGPEIYSNPVQHARIKPPSSALPDAATDANVAKTVWHQDAAVVEPVADETDTLTVWVAMTDATVDNGCLIAVPRNGYQDRTLHCPGKLFQAEIYIPDQIIDQQRVIPLEVGAGGIVLLHKLTEHASPDNTTDDIRWSFDLRYQPIGQPTGRDVFPGFVARSMADPDSVLSDHQQWAQLWWDARDRIASGEVDMRFGGRWNHNSTQPVCA
ncbi:MAG: phytanoyl-CoA dioxygenase [Acidimicrobiia bacterium]|nr:phytanoyl-CoA dioxygenase [Acidimicrobiia bacterium]